MSSPASPVRRYERYLALRDDLRQLACEAAELGLDDEQRRITRMADDAESMAQEIASRLIAMGYAGPEIL